MCNNSEVMKVESLTLLFSLLFLPLGLGAAPDREKWPDGPNPPAEAYDDVHRFVFFAVLEGCFTDGITDADLEFIIPTAENGGRKMITNFVIACPLCRPAYDAFHFYANRPHLSQPAKHTHYTTFGAGLEPAIRQQLAEPGLPCRNAIQDLIERWVSARITKLRLNEEEEKSLRSALADKRKKGEEWLARFREGKHGEELAENYQDWENCPICSGSSPMGGSGDGRE